MRPEREGCAELLLPVRLGVGVVVVVDVGVGGRGLLMGAAAPRRPYRRLRRARPPPPPPPPPRLPRSRRRCPRRAAPVAAEGPGSAAAAAAAAPGLMFGRNPLACMLGPAADGALDARAARLHAAHARLYRLVLLRLDGPGRRSWTRAATADARRARMGVLESRALRRRTRTSVRTGVVRGWSGRPRLAKQASKRSRTRLRAAPERLRKCGRRSRNSRRLTAVRRRRSGDRGAVVAVSALKARTRSGTTRPEAAA